MFDGVLKYIMPTFIYNPTSFKFLSQRYPKSQDKIIYVITFANTVTRSYNQDKNNPLNLPHEQMQTPTF